MMSGCRFSCLFVCGLLPPICLFALLYLHTWLLHSVLLPISQQGDEDGEEGEWEEVQDEAEIDAIEKKGQGAAAPAATRSGQELMVVETGLGARRAEGLTIRNMDMMGGTRTYAASACVAVSSSIELNPARAISSCVLNAFPLRWLLSCVSECAEHLAIRNSYQSMYCRTVGD